MIIVNNGFLEARVTPWRSELVGLRDAKGRDYVWDGNPEIWKGSSPILFPLVGMVPDDTVKIGGRAFNLRQHGFAPASEFDVVSVEASECRLRLSSSPQTLELYPFEFTLDISYRLEGRTLIMGALVTNRSAQPMPYSFGFHPGFRWPIPDAGPREDHFVEFDQNQPAPIRRPLNGLLDPREFPTPIAGGRLDLQDKLFNDGAMMFLKLRSRALCFASSKGPSLRIEWKNLPHLGLWTKPGAHYLCVEPWQGYPAPVGFAGELSEKPGILILDPGAHHSFEMSVTIVGDDKSSRD